MGKMSATEPKTSPTSESDGASYTATAYERDTADILLQLSTAHGRTLRMFLRHEGPNGEYAPFRVYVEKKDMIVALIPLAAWAWGRNRHGEWVRGNGVIHVRNYLTQAHRRGRGREAIGKLREAITHLDGEGEERRISLAHLRRLDPDLAGRIRAALVGQGLPESPEMASECPESGAEPLDDRRILSETPGASEGPSWPSNEEVPF